MAEQFIESTLMDGYVGGPHITETQTGLANQGLYGPDDYVLSSGRKAEAQVLTNNSIRIFDAVFVIQGRRDVIAANDYTDVSIDNGAQGMNRNDIIVRRYTKDESSEIENTEYAVIKGTPTSGEAEDPAVTIGDIRSGALEHEMKLYRVKLEGLNIVAVEPLFQVLMDMSTLNAYLSDLINETTTVEYDKTVINFTSAWSTHHCEVYKTGRIVQLSARIYSGTILKDHEYTIANVNTEFRPAHETPIYAVAGDVYMQNLVPCMCSIQPSGKILFKASGEQKQYVDIAGTYIV